MRLLSLIALGVGLVHAQSTTLATSTTSSTSSSTSSSAITTHTVDAGALGEFVFTPNTTIADVGDIIEFRFYPLNHSVAQAAFGQACIPYSLSGLDRQGFWSDFFPVAVYDGSAPGYQVRVNDTNPIFFYCAAPDACTGDGMVGVINPNSTETLEAQYKSAKNATVQLVPGEGFPSESSPTSTSSTGTSTATSTPGSSSSHHSSGLSGGAIAGIVVGAVALICLAGALFYVCGRERTLSQILKLKHDKSFGEHASPPGHFSPASQWSHPDKPHTDMGVNPVAYGQSPSEMGDDSHIRNDTGRWSSNSGSMGSPGMDQRRSASPTNSYLGQHTSGGAYDNGMQSIPEAMRGGPVELDNGPHELPDTTGTNAHNAQSPTIGGEKNPRYGRNAS